MLCDLFSGRERGGLSQQPLDLGGLDVEPAELIPAAPELTRQNPVSHLLVAQG